MFGHKSFLRIESLNDFSISGLYKDSYELDSCSYSFSQGVDSNGKPQTAYCVNFDRNIIDKEGIQTRLLISPDEILINGISFDNHWV